MSWGALGLGLPPNLHVTELGGRVQGTVLRVWPEGP